MIDSLLFDSLLFFPHWIETKVVIKKQTSRRNEENIAESSQPRAKCRKCSDRQKGISPRLLPFFLIRFPIGNTRPASLPRLTAMSDQYEQLENLDAAPPATPRSDVSSGLQKTARSSFLQHPHRPVERECPKEEERKERKE